jgi:hypothetical protein
MLSAHFNHFQEHTYRLMVTVSKQFKAQSKKRLLIWLGVAVISLALMQVVVANLRLRVSLHQRQQDKQAAKVAADAAYQALLEQQTQEQTERAQLRQQAPLERSQLVGIQNLYIFFVRPPETSDAQIMPLIKQLQQFSSARYDSLFSVHTFFAEQARNYQAKPFTLVIHLAPTIEELDVNRVGDVLEFWDRDVYAVQKLQDQFATILSKHQITLGEGKSALFIYFDDSFFGTTNADSFYDQKAFRSFSDEGQRQAYVNAYDFSVAFAPTLVEIVAHETLHLFGAKDKYLENEYGCEATGRGEIDRQPTFPQATADIMCGLIERWEGEFRRAKFQQGELVINQHTAAEIGWIPLSE